MSDPTTPAVKGTQPTCPQYIELHGYCALTQGHDGDCELTNDAADVERLQAKVAELEARRAVSEAPAAPERVRTAPPQERAGSYKGAASMMVPAREVAEKSLPLVAAVAWVLADMEGFDLPRVSQWKAKLREALRPSTPAGAPTTTCFVCGSTIDVIERLVHGKRIPECDRCTRTRWNTPSRDPSHG